MRRGRLFTVGVLAAVATLVIVAAWQRLELLSESAGAVGLDGYWYAAQERSLLSSGHLHYPSLPVALWLLVPFAAAAGPIAGVKIGAAVLTAAHVGAAALLAWALTKRRSGALLAAALVATSPTSIYLATEFVKQGIALTLATLALAAAVCAARTPTRLRIGLAATAALATAASHKLGLAIVVIAACGFAGTLRQRWPRPTTRAGLAVAGVAMVALLSFWREPTLLDGRVDLSVPVLTFPNGLAMVYGHEPLWAALAALAAVSAFAIAYRRGALPEGALGAATLVPVATLALLALAAAIPVLDVTAARGLAPRLRLCSHLALGPLAACALAWLPGRWHRTGSVAALLLATLVLAVRPFASEEGVIRAHPALVDAATRAAHALPPGAVVITPDRQVSFMVAYATGHATRIRPRVPGTRPQYRLLPGGWIDDELAAALRAATGPDAPVNHHATHPFGMMLMTEAVYQRIRQDLPPASSRYYQQWESRGSLPRPPEVRLRWWQSNPVEEMP